MKTLIVEDEFTNRIILQQTLEVYGVVHVAVNGVEAVEAVRAALDAHAPYDLICLDIMMPEMDGQEALKQIRALELERKKCGSDGVKIIMTTALTDPVSIMQAFCEQTDAYIVKPVDRGALIKELRRLGLVE